MRLSFSLSWLLGGTALLVQTACSPKQENKPEPLAKLTLSVDMPKEQTIQFLKQSASTLKLSPVAMPSPDQIVAHQITAAVSGPPTGPVTVLFSGRSDEAKMWSEIMIDKLPAKKL